MKKIFTTIAVILLILIGGFYALNSYIYNEKQGDGQIPAMTDTSTMYSDLGYVYFGNEAKGDLDADGVDDVAFLVTKDEGGSGTFYYLGVAFGSSNGYLRTNTVFLGDRIAPQTTEIRDRVLTVNYADRKAGEPMTAQPSVGVSKSFRVVNGILAPAQN